MTGSGRLDHEPGFNAAGADHHAFGLTVVKRTDRLQVRVEAPFIDIVRMADMAAHHWFFAANFTLLGHCRFPFD